MHHNVGGIDQILRIVLGVVICTIGVIYNNWWGLVGLIPLVTGTMSWCPVYNLVGLSSLKISESET
ncbi:MAG: YgaP family membrane protein [bacterium]